MRFQAEEGANVTLVAGRDSDLDHLSGEPFDVRTCDQLINELQPIKFGRTIEELREMFESCRADVVHTHQGTAGLLGRTAAILSGVPCIVYGLHGDHVEHPKLNRVTRPIFHGIEKLLGRYTDYFVSVGREIRQRYRDRGIGTPDQHVVIPSAIELDWFRSSCFDSEDERVAKKHDLGIAHSEAPVVGMVASLEPRKGYDDALGVACEMLERSAVPDIQFLFVGNGPLREELERKACEKNIADRVIFTGFREDIADVMECFDLFMFTSHMEGLPQVLVQAAATGLPAVTFDVEGASEIIQDGSSGYVLPERNHGEMVDCLIELLTDNEKRERFGENARRHASSRWSIDNMRTNVKQFYRRIRSDLRNLRHASR